VDLSDTIQIFLIYIFVDNYIDSENSRVIKSLTDTRMTNGFTEIEG